MATKKEAPMPTKKDMPKGMPPKAMPPKGMPPKGPHGHMMSEADMKKMMGGKKGK